MTIMQLKDKQRQFAEGHMQGHDAAATIKLLVTHMLDQEERIAALEGDKNNANKDLKRALMDADNAIQKAVAHFRRTDAENV